MRGCICQSMGGGREYVGHCVGHCVSQSVDQLVGLCVGQCVGGSSVRVLKISNN